MDAKMSTDEVVAEIDKAFKRGGRQGWNEGFTAGVRWSNEFDLAAEPLAEPPNPYETPKEESHAE